MRNTNTFSQKPIFLFLTAILLLAACEDPGLRNREKGALAGGAVGAGLGAIIGNQVGSSGAGIAIGSALGALSGALVGHAIDNTEDSLAVTEQRLAQQESELAENRRLLDELRRENVDVRRTDRGLVVNLPDVLLEFDKSRLTNNARSTVADIANVLKNYQARRISVEGHTDSIGTASYNQKLSEARARSVADELVNNGISPGKITTRGFGENDPIASNLSEAGRSRNRRVEVIIENN